MYSLWRFALSGKWERYIQTRFTRQKDSISIQSQIYETKVLLKVVINIVLGLWKCYWVASKNILKYKIQFFSPHFKRCFRRVKHIYATPQKVDVDQTATLVVHTKEVRKIEQDNWDSSWRRKKHSPPCASQAIEAARIFKKITELAHWADLV